MRTATRAVANIPPGGCTPQHVVAVSVTASPSGQVVPDTRIQLTGISQEEILDVQCELEERPLPFTWTLAFQAPGGGEIDETGHLVSRTTLTPFFIATQEGTYRARLRGGKAALGFKTDVVEVVVVPPPPVLLRFSGHLTFLRVNDLGGGFGPPNDFIDAEAEVRLDSQAAKAFGFQLRNDRNRPARQGMLDLLRDAFNHNWTVALDCFVVPGRNNGVIIRVELTK